jgi:hypothetical protein
MFKPSFRQGLENLDWKIKETEDTAKLEKDSALTTMAAKAVIKRLQDGSYSYVVRLFDPDGNVIKGYASSGDSLALFGDILLGIIESYLSGATNVPEDLSYFKRYRKKTAHS